ncbi:hypothetical protein FVEN_g1285 [Fusarium venenatum]|uniref:Uncharacterized protein n=1 Tax=Fusarium venenatum TaxID=56646 RepID=A0A2L2SQD2_9HYPO|nr:uncharacterized protein FVRRES_12925 [Fusarium venenatum]KAG8361168.1 hypothetical protein FVEN_g1285 [Fusarium venenatum]KAH6979498.1 hypothetical protein EDB82DRAFT_508164 [Fusarium venenatum]CEI40234.1 unnamed protein product [Fusarium venenatum]
MADNNYFPPTPPDPNDEIDQPWLDPGLIDPNLLDLNQSNSPSASRKIPQSSQPPIVPTHDPTLAPAINPITDEPIFKSPTVPPQNQPARTLGFPVPTPAYPDGYPPLDPRFPIFNTSFPPPVFSNPSPAPSGPSPSPSPYLKPADVLNQAPSISPAAPDSDTTKGKKRGRAPSPTADKPRRTRRKTAKSAAAEDDGNQVDSPASNDNTPVSKRTRSRAKTSAKSKASSSGTNTSTSTRPARGPDKASKNYYIRPSRLAMPNNEGTAPPLVLKTTNRKDKKKGKDENADMAKDKQTSVSTRGDHDIAKGGICDFCANHPIGKTMFIANPVCDWEQIPSMGPDVFNRECGNCADYRSRNRQPGDVATDNDHMCRVPGVKSALVDFKYKQYGDTDPPTFAEPACDRCSNNGASETCDVDAMLGYVCSHCRRDQRCCVDDSLIPMQRPKKMTISAWYRHACDRCLARHLQFKTMKGDECCNWLTNRRLWGDTQKQGCTRCLQDGAPCMDDKSNIIALPSHEPPPTTWCIRDKFEVDENKKLKNRKIKWYEYVEATTGTIWRKKCTGCQWAGASVECLVMWHQSGYACERCTQFGVDCTTYDVQNDAWTRYPIYDLSRVGFGQYTPYVVCKSCKDNGRNCDRMRPCDSCTSTGSACDGLKKDNAHGCISRFKIAEHGTGQQAPPPGPLYYLALGYGPGGVNDIKDGRSVEHWIGPVAPVYGINTLKDGAAHYRAVADLHRGHRPPSNVLPPGITAPLSTAEGTPGVFKDVQSRELTVEQLAALILHFWPGYQVPVGDGQAYRTVWNSLCDAQNTKMAEAGIDASMAPAMPRTFEGNPVLSDLEALHSGLLGLPARQNAAPQAPAQPPTPGFLIQAPGVTSGLYMDDLYDGGFILPDPIQQPVVNGPQQEENSYAAVDNLIASGLFGYQQGGDDQQAQQAQQAQPPAESGPNIDITTMNQDSLRRMLGLDEDKPRGRFMANHNYAGIFKAHSRRKAFANRGPKDTNTKDKSFNPFLGFVLGENQKPRLKTKEKSSRWKAFNPLEGFDMEKWHRSSNQPDERSSEPRLFSVVNGQWKQPAPQANVLDDIPYQQKGGKSQQRCAEPGNGGIGRCGSRNVNGQDQADCQSLAHRNTMPGYFPICDNCVQGNVKDMFRHDHSPVTENELLSMRAYLCNDCAGHMSSSVQNAIEYRAIGARRIYGIVADTEHPQSTYTPDNDPSRAVEFRNTEALTGCSCANRMFGTSLCRFHRLHYAEEALKFSALMQEWRLSCFKKAVCPGCLARKPLDSVNLSADSGGFLNGAPTAWACVNCNDWVANEKNDGTNQPSLIDKKLWNSNIGREILGPRQKAVHAGVRQIEDVEMGGM